VHRAILQGITQNMLTSGERMILGGGGEGDGCQKIGLPGVQKWACKALWQVADDCGIHTTRS